MLLTQEHDINWSKLIVTFNKTVMKTEKLLKRSRRVIDIGLWNIVDLSKVFHFEHVYCMRRSLFFFSTKFVLKHRNMKRNHHYHFVASEETFGSPTKKQNRISVFAKFLFNGMFWWRTGFFFCKASKSQEEFMKKNPIWNLSCILKVICIQSMDNILKTSPKS